jgi:hypothetical protein
MSMLASPKHYTSKKRSGNVKRDRAGAIKFVQSWTDVMVKPQFCLTRQDFRYLHNKIIFYKFKNGYNQEQHHEYAYRSSGSPITLELRLYMTLRLLSGASYLDLIWYGCEINSIPLIFWKTICLIDAALDNI